MTDKIVSHEKRYRVESRLSNYYVWKARTTFRLKCNAVRYARRRESLGYFQYRVVDTRA